MDSGEEQEYLPVNQVGCGLMPVFDAQLAGELTAADMWGGEWASNYAWVAFVESERVWNLVEGHGNDIADDLEAMMDKGLLTAKNFGEDIDVAEYRRLRGEGLGMTVVFKASGKALDALDGFGNGC